MINYNLLPVSDKMVEKAIKSLPLVKLEYIRENSKTIVVIVPRLKDNETFRTPMVNKETGEWMCSCERYLMFNNVLCSHIIVVLEILGQKYGEEYVNTLIFKILEVIMNSEEKEKEDASRYY